jgi:hypothetical protein
VAGEVRLVTAQSLMFGVWANNQVGMPATRSVTFAGRVTKTCSWWRTSGTGSRLKLRPTRAVKRRSRPGCSPARAHPGDALILAVTERLGCPVLTRDGYWKWMVDQGLLGVLVVIP